MLRLRGLAPYSLSNPSDVIQDLAASDNSRSMPCSTSFPLRLSIIISTIWSWSSSEIGWNIKISSTLFKNSGLNDFFSASSIEILNFSLSFELSMSLKKPNGSEVLIDDPKLLVMIITVFLKSTTLPWPSVSLPSSRICNNILKTSGCAFSISSKRITLKGLFLTASVS